MRRPPCAYAFLTTATSTAPARPSLRESHVNPGLGQELDARVPTANVAPRRLPGGWDELALALSVGPAGKGSSGARPGRGAVLVGVDDGRSSSCADGRGDGQVPI